MNNLRVADMAREERPVEKALNQGIDVLSDSELLAIIIKCGTKEHSAINLAQTILNKHPVYKGLPGLNYMTVNELTEIPGIGKMKAVQIMAITELSKRLSRISFKERLTFNEPRTVADYYMEKVRYLEKERVYILYLSTSGSLLKEHLLSEGSLDRSIVSQREIFSQALKLNAASLIILHNHPSGDPSPSEADLFSTKTVIKAGKILGIKVLDHIIIGDKKYISLAERGFINEN